MMATTLRRITEDDLEMIMKWRMSETVTKFMNTNPKLTIEKQKEWYASLEKNNKVKNWIIEVNGTPAGLINLADIDWGGRNSSWGYYIGEESLRSLTLAISLEMSLYDYVFDVLGFTEIHNEAFKLNEGVWKLHVACGCHIVKETAGEIEKEGVAYDIVHLSITRDEWYAIRERKKYEKINYDIFPDPIGGMVYHHLGIAVYDIESSINAYKGMGWKITGDIVYDDDRSVKLVFMQDKEAVQTLELVAPMNEKSPVSQILTSRKDVSTPYHMCYEVNDINLTVSILKSRGYVQTTPIEPAVAFKKRKVVFMVSKAGGLIELLEKGV